MQIKGIKTHIYTGKEDLTSFLVNYIQAPKATLAPKDVLVISSKLISHSEHLTVDKESHLNKYELIKQECEHYLCSGPYGYHLTIKNNLIMPTAGIDHSNCDNSLILLPKNMHQLTKKLHKSLSSRLGFDDFGLIVTDSKSMPLRHGTTGFSLSYYGFKGLLDLRNTEDLFSNKMKVTKVNQVDPLAAAAVLVMGETNQQTPLAIIKGANLTFEKEERPSLYIDDWQEDVYSALYKHFLNKN